MAKGHRRGAKGEQADRVKAAIRAGKLTTGGSTPREVDLVMELLGHGRVLCERCDGAGTVENARSKTGRGKCPACHGAGSVDDAEVRGLVERIIEHGVSVRAQMAITVRVIAQIRRDVAADELLPKEAHALILKAQDSLRRLSELDAAQGGDSLPGAIDIRLVWPEGEDGGGHGDDLLVHSGGSGA